MKTTPVTGTTQIVQRHIHRRVRGGAVGRSGQSARRAIRGLALLTAALVLGSCARELLALALAGAMVMSLGLP